MGLLRLSKGKTIPVFLFTFLFLSFTTYAVSSSSSINFLTRSITDSLYCLINGDCTLSSLLITGNLTIQGFINNVSTVNATLIEDIWVNETGDTMSGNLDMGGNNLTGVSNINPLTGNSVTINPFGTGDSISDEFDLVVGGWGAGGIRLGNAEIVSGGNMSVMDADFNGTSLWLVNGNVTSVFEFALGRIGGNMRLAIPRPEADFGMQMVRSVMVGGNNAGDFNDNIINCTAQGYTFIDCATDRTGADLGVQDDGEFRGSVFINGTLFLGHVRLTNLSDNGLWNGSLNVYANPTSNNNLLFKVGHSDDGTSHFWIQEGAPEQASGVSRSFMIVNEMASVQNTTNLTSCRAVQDLLGVPSAFQVDCNTTTTGADLLVADDALIDGDFFIQDEENEYHSMNRIVQRLDEQFNNILFNRINAKIVGSDLNITDIGNDNLAVLLNGTASELGTLSQKVALTTGTLTNPTFNFVSYQNQVSPSLTVTTSIPNVDHADVSRLYIGDDTTQVYFFDEMASHGFQVIDNIYDRFDDQGALYRSGLDIGVNTTVINISSGLVRIRILLVNYQNNLSSNKDFYHINSTGNFINLTSIDDITQYSGGEDIGNNRFFNVVWGVVPVNGTGMRLLAVVQDDPSTEYANVLDAEIDELSSTNFFPSNTNIRPAFVPVARTIIKNQVGQNNFQTFRSGLLFQDIRGQATSGGGSAGSPAIQDHDDLNNLDFATAGHIDFVSDLALAGNRSEIEVAINGNRSVIEAGIVGNITLIIASILGNRTEIELGIVGNRTEIELGIAANRTEIEAGIVGNRTEVDENITLLRNAMLQNNSLFLQNNSDSIFNNLNITNNATFNDATIEKLNISNVVWYQPGTVIYFGKTSINTTFNGTCVFDASTTVTWEKC